MNESPTAPPARGVRVLVCAASKHGATTEIAEAIGRSLSGDGFAVTVLPLNGSCSILSFTTTRSSLGSAVYTGHLARGRPGPGQPVPRFARGPPGVAVLQRPRR